ncbi:MAG: hypothetical protein ACK5H1_03775 [Tenacibaculum sp.]
MFKSNHLYICAAFIKQQVILAVFLFSILIDVSGQIDRYSLLSLPRSKSENFNNIINPKPKEGSLVYNTDDKKIYKYNGTNWEIVHKENAVVYGDIKYGIQTSDHLGWYELNGRSLTELPEKAQGVAISLGLSGSLPDAKGLFLKVKDEGESIFNSGGQNSVVLAKENLPNVNFIGTTLEGEGGHEHTGVTSQGGAHQHFSGQKEKAYAHTEPKKDPIETFAVTNSNDIATTFNEDHTHTFSTGVSGNHIHNFSINTGGSDKAIENRPSFLSVNTFIYLGN